MPACCALTFADQRMEHRVYLQQKQEAADRLAGRPAHWRFDRSSRIPRQWNFAVAKGRGHGSFYPIDAVVPLCRHRRTEAVPEYHRRGTGCACWMSRILWVPVRTISAPLLPAKCCTTNKRSIVTVSSMGKCGATRESHYSATRLRLSA